VRKLWKIAAFAGVAATSGLLFSRVRRPHSTFMSGQNSKPRIVVAGGGFGGIATLRALGSELPRGAADILLVDQNNYHLFTPLLYQAATGAVDSTNITYSLRRFCALQGFRFLASTIHGVDPIKKTLTTSSGQLPYDYLVLGLGSQTNYFGMIEIQQRAFSLKTVPDAATLRRQIFRNFERAAQLTDREQQRRLLTFIVVGGGATGVELIGSIHDLVRFNLLRYYPEIDESDARIILLEAGSALLAGIDERLGRIALRRFEEIGVDVHLNTMVAGVRDGAVITRDGARIPGEIIVWTAGIRPNPITAGLAVEKARDGRILVDAHLRVPAFTSIFALGDNAASLDPESGNPLPPNAAVAVEEGKSVGQNLARLVRGQPLEPFNYRAMGELVALGRLHAAAELGPIVFDGVPAWLVWRVVYLTKLIGAKNRAGLLLDWLASAFAHREIVDAEAGD
jgi:NADH:ubiquinone reductase (H+-translocating)